MPIYHVQPVVTLLEDSAWVSSDTRSECWVNAVDAAEARGLVSGRYENAPVNMPGHSGGPSPWRDERLVRVQEVEAAPNGTTLAPGVILGAA
jgi:hypothetical protein